MKKARICSMPKNERYHSRTVWRYSPGNTYIKQRYPVGIIFAFCILRVPTEQRPNRHFLSNLFMFARIFPCLNYLSIFPGCEQVLFIYCPRIARSICFANSSIRSCMPGARIASPGLFAVCIRQKRGGSINVLFRQSAPSTCWAMISLPL